MPSISAIVCVMATLMEAAPLIKGLGLSKTGGHPFPLYRKDDIILVISGIGKANAAMAAGYCCFAFHPLMVCNLGAAGSVKASCPLGDIYHINKVIEYDRPSLRSGNPHIYFPHTLDGFATATLATQDKPVIDLDERRKLSDSVDLVDMEAASIIQASKKFHILSVVFKFVSDTPAQPDQSDILKNIRLYVEAFSDFFISRVIPLLREFASPRFTG